MTSQPSNPFKGIPNQWLGKSDDTWTSLETEKAALADELIPVPQDPDRHSLAVDTGNRMHSFPVVFGDPRDLSTGPEQTP